MAMSCTRFSWITAQVDTTEHAVTDQAHAIGMDAGKGIYEALCGTSFRSACMDIGPLRQCPSCLRVVRARASLRNFEERITEHRRPGWLSRLLCRYQEPADVGCEETRIKASPTVVGSNCRGSHAA